MELDAQRVRQVEGNGALESTLKKINVIEKLQRLRREWSSVENLQRTLSWKPKEVFPRETDRVNADKRSNSTRGEL